MNSRNLHTPLNIMKNLWLILPMLVLQGCPGYGYKYNTGSLPDYPVNFGEINTPYDDYNATAPTLGETFPFCFSSTRNSKGGDFDIIYKLITIEFSKTTGELSVLDNSNSSLGVASENANLNTAVKRINTLADELGPYLIPLYDYKFSEPAGYYGLHILLYSNDEKGDQDIFFTENTENVNYGEPLPVDFLNSDADDAYPCFNADCSALYFTSNRGGSFDIYKALTDPDKEILETLANGEPVHVEKDTILSSPWDDKCPYIAYNTRVLYDTETVNNMLVFASDREGGYGGFDLYYSLLEDGAWTRPVNFGAAINTEFDEYRPIVRPLYEFTNDFMIFSSNRPGGKGGFDLYYVGIEDIGPPTNW